MLPSRTSALGYSAVVCGAGYLGTIGRGGPAPEQSEGLMGAAAGLCRVDVDRESVVCRELERLVAELEIADDRVVQALGPGLVEADVVCCPTGPELGAAGG